MPAPSPIIFGETLHSKRAFSIPESKYCDSAPDGYDPAALTAFFSGCGSYGGRLPWAVGPLSSTFACTKHAIVKNRFASGAKQLSVFIKTRPVEDDVVGLPLAGRTRSVHQWRVLAIDRASLASA